MKAIAHREVCSAPESVEAHYSTGPHQHSVDPVRAKPVVPSVQIEVPHYRIWNPSIVSFNENILISYNCECAKPPSKPRREIRIGLLNNHNEIEAQRNLRLTDGPRVTEDMRLFVHGGNL